RHRERHDAEPALRQLPALRGEVPAAALAADLPPAVERVAPAHRFRAGLHLRVVRLLLALVLAARYSQPLGPCRSEPSSELRSGPAPGPSFRSLAYSR